MTKYSKTTDKIYIAGVHKDIPADAVSITDAEVQVFLGNKTEEGRQRVKNAYPFVFVDIPCATCAEIAAANQAAAKTLRDSSIDNYIGSVTYYDSVFDADSKSLVNIDTAVRLAISAGQTETSWRLSDNTWRPTTITEIAEIRDLIQSDVDANFAKVWLAFGVWDAGSESDKQTPFAVS